MPSSFETVLRQLDDDARRERDLQLRAKQQQRKSSTVAHALAFSLGMFGAHHFYLRRPFFGVSYFLTLGLFGVGYIVDLFRIGSLVDEANEDSEVDLESKTNIDAYVLWFPCGILGFHQFYLGNYCLGFVYLCTFGVYGFGWIIDFFRIPSLVSIYNSPLEDVPKKKSKTTAYMFALSPFGILGLHHYYLNRWKWGVLYTLTCGVFGVGWLVDFFRVPHLIARENKHLRGEGLGLVHTDDVYLLWFSFGLFGAHHYYLGRKGWALLYLCTFGFFTIGWLLDICRIPCLVLTQNNHAVIDDIDDTKYASSVEFVSTIYDKTVEMECIPERKVVQERTLDLDHFAIKNKTPVQQISPPKQYENSFFQPLESPIHRRSLSSSNLAGKLGPKRAPSVRTTKTQVQSLPPSPRKACDHDSSDDDDVIITKVITTPRGNGTKVNGLPPISRNGGKPVLQTMCTAYDETIDEQTVNTPRYDDVERKDKEVTQQNEDKLLQNKVTNFCIDDSTMSNKMTNCRENSRSDDVVVKKIVITPRSNDTVTAKKVKSPRYNDVGITSIGGRPRSDDEDLTHRGRGPVWDGRGDDITETCEGLSPREVTQWMSWREDDIIL